MKFLLKWAWIFLVLCIVFDAASEQLFFYAVSQTNIVYRIVFALGGLTGDIPFALIAGVVIAAVTHFGYRYPFTARLAAVSLGLGFIINTVCIHPILARFYA